MGSIHAHGGSTVEVTREHFFYQEIVSFTQEAQYFVNGKAVNHPGAVIRRRIVLRWGNILLAVGVLAILGFGCAQLAGF